MTGQTSGLSLSEFNGLDETAAIDLLLGCCHCRWWAESMAAGRPYENQAALRRAAQEVWSQTTREHWLEAMAAHPIIGDMKRLRARYDADAVAVAAAMGEQGQVIGASEVALTELAALNAAYRERHGFLFIVCASGKSAEEMLTLLKSRIDNTTQQELATASREQAAITTLRLDGAIVDAGPAH